MSNYQKTDLNTEAYEPFMLEDKQAGEVHWLNQTNSNDAPTFSGLWKCEPMDLGVFMRQTFIANGNTKFLRPYTFGRAPLFRPP